MWRLISENQKELDMIAPERPTDNLPEILKSTDETPLTYIRFKFESVSPWEINDLPDFYYRNLKDVLNNMLWYQYLPPSSAFCNDYGMAHPTYVVVNVTTDLDNFYIDVLVIDSFEAVEKCEQLYAKN